MNDERWENLTKMIASRFEIEEDYSEVLPAAEGGGQVEVVVCQAPIGKIKIERYVRPVVVGKKTLYSKRGGSETIVNYEYSKNENTQSIKLYKFDEYNERWQELSPNNMADILG